MEKGVYGIVLSHRRLLLISKKEIWVLPGGKYNFEGESDEDVLKREFRQKLSGTDISMGDYYKSIEGIIPNMYEKIYFCSSVKGIGAPSPEINGVRYVNSRSLGEVNFSDITKKVLISLINDKLVD